MKTLQSIGPVSAPPFGVLLLGRRLAQGRGLIVLSAALAAYLFPGLALAGLPTYVQSHYEVSTLPRAKMTVVYTDAQKADDLNVVIVGWRDAIAQVTSVTDTSGNLYIPAVTASLFVSVPLSQNIYYAFKILPALARENTVTVKFSAPAATPDIRTLEYSGIVRFQNPVVAATIGAGVSNWSRSGNAQTLFGPQLLVATVIVGAGTRTIGPTGSFTQRIVTSQGDDVEDRLVTDFNIYNAGARLSVAGPWMMQMVIFHGLDLFDQ